MNDRICSLEETIEEAADFLCDERVSRLCTELREHPDDYPRYHEIRQDVRRAEEAVRAALGDSPHLLTALLESINLRDGIEQEHIYKLGFMDGGRVCHGFVTHELPPQLVHTGEGGA